MGTDTIIVTIRSVYGHDRACHRLPKPLHPATRIRIHPGGVQETGWV